MATFMRRIVAHEPARHVPSERECGWCEVSSEDCSERIEPEMAQSPPCYNAGRHGGSTVATQISQTTQETSQGRMLSEDEARMIQENLARENFGMTLNEFIESWKAGEFDDDHERHNKVVRLAMLIPECWDD